MNKAVTWQLADACKLFLTQSQAEISQTWRCKTFHFFLRVTYVSKDQPETCY